MWGLIWVIVWREGEINWVHSQHRMKLLWYWSNQWQSCLNTRQDDCQALELQSWCRGVTDHSARGFHWRPRASYRSFEAFVKLRSWTEGESGAFSSDITFSGLFVLFFQGSDETIRVVSMDKDYHVECYHCEVSKNTSKCKMCVF